MAKTNIVISFVIKPSETNAEGLAPIYCRFKVGASEKKEISMGPEFRVEPSQWIDGKITIAKKASKEHKSLVSSLNQAIEDMRTHVWQSYNQMVAIKANDGIVLTSAMLKEYIMQKTVQRKFDDCKIALMRLYKQGTNAYKKASIACRRFEEFILKEFKTDVLMELQEKSGIPEMFHTYCTKDLGWMGSHTKKIFGFIRKAFKIAKKNGWISKEIEMPYTFRDHGHKLKEYLTTEELKVIIEKNFESESLQTYADIFVFQCFTGIAYADVKKMTYEDIKEVNGELFLKDFRQKTKVEYNIPLLPVAVEILEKYKVKAKKPVKSTDKALPVKSNGNYNIRLKTIMDICGINKSVSTHCARYTCNMMLYEMGVSPEIRQQILGHNAVEMTEKYTFKKPEVLRDAMRKIII